jgi:membrane protein required for colicin V production
MHFIDILIIIPLAWSLFRGFGKGLIVELSSLVALFLGILAGIYFSDFVAGLLIEHAGFNPHYTSAIAFTIIFIAVLILVRLLAKAVEKVAKTLALGFFNKVLGAVFAFFKTAFIISLVFFIIEQMNVGGSIISNKTKDKSLLYKPVSAIAPLAIPKIKSVAEKIQNSDVLPSEKPDEKEKSD